MAALLSIISCVSCFSLAARSRRCSSSRCALRGGENARRSQRHGTGGSEARQQGSGQATRDAPACSSGRRRLRRLLIGSVVVAVVVVVVRRLRCAALAPPQRAARHQRERLLPAQRKHGGARVSRRR